MDGATELTPSPAITPAGTPQPHKTLNPIGLVTFSTLLLTDMARGVGGFTQQQLEPIPFVTLWLQYEKAFRKLWDFLPTAFLDAACEFLGAKKPST